MRKAVAGKSRFAAAPRASVPRPAPPSPRPFSEVHDSREDANAALDQLERCVEVVLAAGGEFALRRRLAKALGPGALV
jgi:hypothetical protein